LLSSGRRPHLLGGHCDTHFPTTSRRHGYRADRASDRANRNGATAFLLADLELLAGSNDAAGVQ
jgi:hypothetical protein